MDISGNTIVITGGGSGIGRALAEALHKAGNKVVIAGRRKSALDAVTAANPGMAALTLDVADPASVAAFAAALARDFPAANVLVNNSGVMRPEDLAAPAIDLSIPEETIATNLLGPIRLTAAVLPQLRKQPKSTVVMVTSGLAFVPLVTTPTYCATKAAVHSYTLSLRHQLRETTTEVLELIPPYVQTELMGEGQAKDPRAMPLAEFIAEVMGLLGSKPTPAEICVGRVKPLRFAAESGQFDAVFKGLTAISAEGH